MSILTNTNIVVMVLDLIHIHNFHGQMVTGVKMLSFLEMIIVLLCVFTMKKKTKRNLVLCEVPTQGIDDTAMVAEAYLAIPY